MADTKKDSKSKDLTNDSYVQQMNNTIAQQQKQLDLLSSQMYPSRGSNAVNENANIIPVNQYSTPVVDGGISGRDYYSATPMSFVAPNIESRRRAAAVNLHDYKTVEHFKDNFDSFISNIKNIPGVNDEIYNNLINNAYGAMNELADKKDLENYKRHVKDLSSAILGDWGGNALNQSYNEYQTKREFIREKSEGFDATKTGGYSPAMRAYQEQQLASKFKGLTRNPETGRIEASSFELPDLIEHQNVTHQVSELVKSWKEDGTIQTDKNGNITWIRDIPGSMGMISKESVSEQDLRNYALKYLESAGLGPYMEQQAMINATNAIQGISAREANGENREDILKDMVSRLGKQYNNPLEFTGAYVKRIQDLVKGGKTYSELLLSNGALSLKELMRSKHEDDSIGLPTSREAYTKTTYNNYTDYQEQKDIDFAHEQRLANSGLGRYAEKSSDPTDAGLGTGLVSEGAETYAITTHKDGFIFNDSYSIDNLVKFKDESDNSYKTAYNDLIDLKRKKAQGDKGVSPENIERAEEALKRADDEVKYYKDVMNNISTNVKAKLTANGFSYDKYYNKYAGYFNKINLSKSKFEQMVAEFTSMGEKFGTKIAASLSPGRNEAFNNITKKYLEDIQTSSVSGGEISIKERYRRNRITVAINDIISGINSSLNKLPKAERDTILSPQLDATYIMATGSNAKNTSLKSLESQLSINKTKLRDSPLSFRALDKNGKAVDLIEAMASYANVNKSEIYNLIDWENTAMHPLISKDYILAKKIRTNNGTMTASPLDINDGVQYMTSFAFKTSSPEYKKLESKLKDIRENGNLKLIVTPDAVNAVTSNKEMNEQYAKLFKFLNTTDITAHDADVIKAVGIGWANTNNYSKDFNKYTFYDLNPENKDSVRNVEMNGYNYGVRAIYSDALRKGNTDKDFYISRKDPNKPDSGHYNQILVKENVTGTIKWVGVDDINKTSGKTPKDSQYSRIIANTPQDLLGYMATADLYEGLAREQVSNKMSKGGSIRGASSYNMDKRYRGAASKIRSVESSNNYGLKGDIAYGAYQIVPKHHAEKIKNLYGLSMNQFLANPEAQDKYFEVIAKGYDKFLSGSRGIRLLNIIKTVNPSATYDDALGVVHFWGSGNVLKLLNGRLTVDTKIEYTDNGVKKYNPSLKYHIQKLKRGY